MLYSFRIIPDRGSWIEVQFDTSDLLYIYLDRRKRRRKFLATTFLRALGYGSDEEVIKLFYNIEKLKLSEKLDEESLATKVLTADVLDGEVTVARAFEPLTLAAVRQIMALGHKEVKVIDISHDDTVVKALKKDPAHDQEEALKDIYRKLRPGDPPTVANARALLKRLFFDPKKYDLGRVGRYKLNQKLGIDVDLGERILTDKDFIAAIKYLINLRRGEGTLDDIDHLGSRRVRTVGELLANQCRVGLARTERLVKERMTLFDVNIDGMTPQKLINPKALSAVVRDFFGRSQLSQFMDQTNPLAELTHKRRLSALGPGGLSRDRAGFEVRDVHPSHYGRICPIETPEGPNIGLISSMSTFARINEFGFIETPYRKVENGRVTDQVDYLTGDREENFIVAQANAPMDAKGHFTGEKVSVRYRGDFLEVEPAKVHYMDVSPKQLVSVAAGLIPFLEHDDANRALMGSNMQRQGVPLIVSESPLVGTGLEGKVARDSRAVVVATEARQGRLRYRGPNRRHERRRHAGRPQEAEDRPRSRHPRLRAAQIHALECRHLREPEADREERPAREEGPGHRRRPEHRARRARARPQRARRVHAVERLQLRRRDHDLGEGREGRHLHLDSHRRIRDRRPRHQARPGRNHA